jgi:adapter protein MecA 1/2
MEIERVNEHTLKFFISYVDMEERGFEREEIWYSRERGEELFWEMMDEAHGEEEFPLEGPLWIQVQALEKGLEIIVTRAQLSNDGSKLELPISEDKQVDIPVDDNIENIIDQQINKKNRTSEEEAELVPEDALSFVIGFSDFEDLIALSHRFDSKNVLTSVYHFEDRYYLHAAFDDEVDEGRQDDELSLLLEYGFESNVTIHRLQEYGTTVLEDHALAEFRRHFPLQA